MCILSSDAVPCLAYDRAPTVARKTLTNELPGHKEWTEKIVINVELFNCI